MLYIGIDLGTSAVKLLLMEADGRSRLVGTESRGLVCRGDGRHPGACQ